MWVVLDSIPDEFTPGTIIRNSYVEKAREVSVEVLLLHIGSAKGHKNR
jgi:hypothetical protein